MRFHDALFYRRRLAEYYANCPPPFPLLSSQLCRPIQSYDSKLFSHAVRPGSPPRVDGSATAAEHPTVGVSRANQSLFCREGDQVDAEQPAATASVPLLGALFSYLHPSLAAAAAAAMAHWCLGSGAGGGGTRPPQTADPLRGTAAHVPDWAARLRVEDLLRARSAAAAMTGQASSSSGQYGGLDDGPWVHRAAAGITSEVQSQQPQQMTTSDAAASSEVSFRPYLPDVRPHPTPTVDQRRSPDEEPAAQWDRSDAVSCGSKTPDGDEGSGDSVGGGGGGVEASDGRNSSELVNMERMVHGLKHVQTAAIEKLSKVADSY